MYVIEHETQTNKTNISKKNARSGKANIYPPEFTLFTRLLEEFLIFFYRSYYVRMSLQWALLWCSDIVLHYK